MFLQEGVAAGGMRYRSSKEINFNWLAHFSYMLLMTTSWISLKLYFGERATRTMPRQAVPWFCTEPP